MATDLDRRTFLRAAGLSLVAALQPARSFASADGARLYVSACKKPDGSFAVAVFGPDGTLHRLVDLPARGHDIARHAASGRMIVFARRPGTFALAFALAGDRPPAVIEAAAGRHFYGHGAYSGDGRLLYATENDFDTPRGVIGVYAADDGYRRIAEFDSGGIGPHEMILLADGHTLAVANGGIETHPDFHRTPLNLDSMAPNLTLIDSRQGTAFATFALAAGHHRLSIRHLTVDASGTLWFGCQDQTGDWMNRPPIGRLTATGKIDLLPLPDAVLGDLRGYVGSIAANAGGDRIAATSPVGGAMVVLDAGTGHVVTRRAAQSVSGLAPRGDGFLATTGLGDILAPAGPGPARANLAFDTPARGIES